MAEREKGEDRSQNQNRTDNFNLGVGAAMLGLGSQTTGFGFLQLSQLQKQAEVNAMTGVPSQYIENSKNLALGEMGTGSLEFVIGAAFMWRGANQITRRNRRR